MGATEDAASRRPARPGGTRLIVKRVLENLRVIPRVPMTISRSSCFAVPVDASSSTIVDAQRGAPPPEGAGVQAARESRTASMHTIGSEACVRAATTLLACSRS